MEANTQSTVPKTVDTDERWSGPRKSSGFAWLLMAGYLAYQLYFGGAGGEIAINAVVWLAIASLVIAGLGSLVYLKW